jgi:hypothetical protein
MRHLRRLEPGKIVSPREVLDLEPQEHAVSPPIAARCDGCSAKP